MLETLIIIPTYNEVLNIKILLEQIFSLKTEHKITVLVVDDKSPDGTANLVQDLQKIYCELYLLNRDKKDGLAKAYIAGFKWSLERSFDVIVEMDADLSHQPKYLAEMIKLCNNNDFVIGSRYVKYGGSQRWSFVRLLISSLGSSYARILLGLKIKDLTGGFNLWRREVLEKLDFDRFVSRGFSFQIELKYKAKMLGFKYVEYPIIFNNREHGVSKMNLAIILEGILQVWRIRESKFSYREFFSFALVGGLGTLTNLLVFTLLDKLLTIPLLMPAIIAFILASLQNFILNKTLTFKSNPIKLRTQFLKYYTPVLLLSLVALGLNLIILDFMVPILAPYDIILYGYSRTVAQALGILAGLIINFAGNKYLIYKT